MRTQDQYQIGDWVVYEAQGVLTQVRGYLWAYVIGVPQEIIAYELACGISVSRSAIRHAGPSDHLRPPPPQPDLSQPFPKG